LQASHDTSSERYELLVTPPCPSDSRPTAVDNSSVETVAFLVGRQCFEEVLDAFCCSLHTWYFSIHADFVSIDDELVDEGRDRRRPSRRGTSSDCVGDDIEPGCGNQGGAEARMRLDTGGVDDDRQRQRGRRSTEVAWTTLEGGGGDGAVW
jgi:hypothetical protein